MGISNIYKWSTFDHVRRYAGYPEAVLGIMLPTGGDPGTTGWSCLVNAPAGGFISRKFPQNDYNFGPDSSEEAFIADILSKGCAYVYAGVVQGIPGTVTDQSGVRVSTTRACWLPMYRMPTMLKVRAAVIQFLRTIATDTTIWGTTAHPKAILNSAKIADDGFSGTANLAATVAFMPSGSFSYGPYNDQSFSTESPYYYTASHKPNALILRDFNFDLTTVDANTTSLLNPPFYVREPDVNVEQADEWREYLSTPQGLRAVKAMSPAWHLSAGDPYTPKEHFENRNIAIFAHKNQDPGDGTGGTVGYDYTQFVHGQELDGNTDVHDAVNVLQLATMLKKQRGGSGGVVGTPPNGGARYECYAGTALDPTLVQPGLGSGVTAAKTTFLQNEGFFS